MRFIATLKHDPDHCWALEENEDKAGEWIEGMDRRAAESGVQIHGSYVCPIEHTFYFVLEADDFEGVSSFLGPPMLTDHEAHVSPVLTFGEAERAVR